MYASDFRRHPWLHLASIATIGIASFLLGMFLICYRNFEWISQKMNPQSTGTVYLREGIGQTGIDGLRENILSLSGVKKVEFKDKSRVVGDLQVFLGSASLEPIPGGEIFPDVLEVELSPTVDVESVSILRKKISTYSGVTEVDFSEDWLTQYKKVKDFLGWFGLMLMVLLVGGCGFLIANFMGLRHQARRGELDIVRLMGANHRFLFMPYFAEALIEGVIGAVLALVFLGLAKAFVSTWIVVRWSSLLGIESWLFLSPMHTLGVLSLGVLMALVGGGTLFLKLREN
jgi:cell division transport system permease protein